MSAPHRILSVTLIRHPELEATAGQRALERVAQVTQATWGPLDNVTIHRLSNGAMRWRAEAPVHDADTPADRGDALLRVLAALRTSLQTHPLDAEAARLWERAEIIGSGHTGVALHWGVTVGLHAGVPTTLKVQFLTRQPAVMVEPEQVGALCQGILLAASLPAAPVMAEKPRLRSRRSLR